MTRPLKAGAVFLAVVALVAGAVYLPVSGPPAVAPGGDGPGGGQNEEERPREGSGRLEGGREARADQPPPAGRISGRVLDEEGRPVDGARISLDLFSTDEPVDGSTTTDAGGAFEAADLPDGVWEISVTHEELVLARGPLEVELADGRPIAGRVIRLGRGIDARGKVVRSDTGEPLADVEVVFRPSRPRHYPVYPEGRRTARTSPSGEFSVRGLAEGPHRVDLAARGYLRKALPDVPVTASGERLEVSLEPGHEVSGRVLDAAGEPAAGGKVLVDVRGLGDRERARIYATDATTGEDGSYRIQGLVPLDGCTVLAVHEGHAPGWVSDVRVGPDEEPRRVDFRLQRGGSIRGRVFDEQGRPLAGARVTCRVETCGIDFITPEAAALAGVELYTTTSGEGGEYEFLHLGGKCYGLSAGMDGLLASGAHVSIDPRGGTSLEDVDFHLRTPRSLRGRVTDPRGRPLRGARVEADWKEAETDGDGAFTLEGFSGGRVSVTASREGYEHASLDVRVPREDVSIILQPLAVIAGRVRVPDPADRPYVEIRVFDEAGFERTANVSRSGGGNEGEFEVSVPGGSHVLQAEAPDLAPARSEPIAVRPGERREGIVLDLLPGGTVEGRVIDPTGAPALEAKVFYRPVIRLDIFRAATTRADGAFMLESLPPGEFEIDVLPGLESRYPQAAFGPFTLERGETKELPLELAEGGEIRGVFREGGAPPAGRFRELHVSVSRGAQETYRLGVRPDGTFERSGLLPGDYGVSVWGTRSDGSSYHVEKRPVGVENSRVTRVVFAEPRPIRVEGRVTREGEPLAGATLAAMDPWRDRESSYGWWDLTLASATTGHDGGYQLDLRGDRRYFLLVRERGERGEIQVELELPGAAEAFTFDLDLSRGRLEGVVVEAGTAIPVGDAMVEVFDARKEKRSYLELVRARRGRSRTDGKGRFAIGHLPAGTYSARVAVECSGESWTHGLSVSEGDAAEVRLELRRGIGAAVRLRNRHGDPIRGGRAIVRDPTGNLVAMPRFDEETDRWGLLDLPPVPPGTYEVTVVHPRYAPARIAMRIDERARAPALTLAPGGTLSITVLDASGSVVPRAELVLLDEEGRDVFDDRIPAPNPMVCNPFADRFTGEDGALVLEHVRPGRYRVSAGKGAARSGETGVAIVEKETATARLVLMDR